LLGKPMRAPLCYAEQTLIRFWMFITIGWRRAGASLEST
jgi:hypothetical protein